MNMPFAGAKLALFIGARLAVIRRDDTPRIPWPDYLDLPGGGREGCETPLACALRETREELGLEVPERAVSWGKRFQEEATDVVFVGGVGGWVWCVSRAAFKRKTPRKTSGGKVTNFRKNQFVGEYHLSYNIV